MAVKVVRREKAFKESLRDYEISDIVNELIAIGSFATFDPDNADPKDLNKLLEALYDAKSNINQAIPVIERILKKK